MESRNQLMAERYIVRPRGLPAFSEVIPLALTTLTGKGRSAQIDAVRESRDGHPTKVELDRWLEGQDPTKVRRVSDPSPKLGTVVIDLDEGLAAELTASSDLSVVRDRPLGLIEPQRAGDSKTSLTDSDLWHLEAVGLTRARRAAFGGRGSGVTVAVLDTGVDASHGEFDGKAMEMVTFDVDSWGTETDSTSVDTDGHGTHVAGLIAGRNVGLAPAATVINAVMLPHGRGYLSDFVLALEWTASRTDIAIMNMSAGITGYNEGMEEAVEDLLGLGVLPVVATGNEGPGSTRSPGNYSRVLSVGACNRYGAVASFSGSGAYTVSHHTYRVPDLVAPGEGVTSAVPGGGYQSWKGTSMATPVVSGVAALILEKHPTISVLELSGALIDACLDLGVSVDRQGAGLVQITAAAVDDLSALPGSSSAGSRPLSDRRPNSGPLNSGDRAQ